MQKEEEPPMAYADPQALVSTEWLAAHLEAPRRSLAAYAR